MILFILSLILAPKPLGFVIPFFIIGKYPLETIVFKTGFASNAHLQT
jgi:hypothetical protein